MLENILIRHNVKSKTKVSIKLLVSLALVVLAVGLPQLVHVFAGTTGGIRFLPMYIPVLIGGLFLGFKYGLGIAIFSPLVSFGLTSLMGSPMPALTRLPFMVFELSVIASIAGAFSNKFSKNYLLLIPISILSVIVGRGSFLTLVAILDNVTPLSASVIWSQILNGYIGIILLITICPLLVYVVDKLDKKNN